MPLIETYHFGEYSYGIWKTDESCEELSAQLANDYSTDLSRFSLEVRKKNFLSARLLLKTLTGQERIVCYAPSGKPTLSDGSHHISISHTKEYVTAIVSRKYPVGIDIETISPRVLRIKERFLDINEQRWIDAEHAIVQTLLCWSAKESLFKVIGQENVNFANQLHLSPFNVTTENEIHAFESRTPERKEFTVRYKVFENIVCTSVCDC
jgi:phosphopantetheinyl transferase